MRPTRAKRAANAALATVAATCLAVGLLAALVPVSDASPISQNSSGAVASQPLPTGLIRARLSHIRPGPLGVRPGVLTGFVRDIAVSTSSSPQAGRYLAP
jgi:hypothetical protein